MFGNDRNVIQSAPKKSTFASKPCTQNPGGLEEKYGLCKPHFEIPRDGDTRTKIFFWYVAISLNFKIRLGSVWTNSMVGMAHSFLSICPV